MRPEPRRDCCDTAINEYHLDSCTRVAVPPRPAAPDATAGDGLRSAIYRELVLTTPLYASAAAHITEQILALPALRDVLAAAARDAEAVARVRELAAEFETIGGELHSIRAAEAYTDAGASLRHVLDPL